MKRLRTAAVIGTWLICSCASRSGTFESINDRVTETPNTGTQGEVEGYEDAPYAEDLPPPAPLPAKTDSEITADVRAALARRDGLSENAKATQVSTQKGAVTLRGVVASMSERDVVDAIARNVVGVRDVTNQLEVKD